MDTDKKKLELWDNAKIEAAIAEYLRLLKEASPKADSFFADNLYEPFMKLANLVYSKLSFPSNAGERDDCKQEAVIRLTEKLPFFNPSKCTKAASWAWIVISRVYRNMYRANTLQKYDVRKNVTLDKLSDIELSLITEPDIEDLLAERLAFFVEFWEAHAGEYFSRPLQLKIVSEILKIMRDATGAKIMRNYISKRAGCSVQAVYDVLNEMGRITRAQFELAKAQEK